PDRLEAARDPLTRLLRRLVVEAPRVRLGAHGARADHPRRAGCRALDVAADSGRVLAVEHALGRHRPERPDQLRDLLVAPGGEPLLLLERLVMAERGAAASDREPRRLRLL